jgi:hypothetical protein
MQRVSNRMTQLAFITNATARYAGKERAIVIEVQPDTASVRLQGTRTRYEISWRGVFDYAARVTADRVRAERIAARKARRG